MKIIRKILTYLPHFIITFLVKLKIHNYSYYFHLFPVKKSKIVFCNFFGNAYGDSPKYIAEKLIEKNIDCSLVWLLKKELIGKAEFPEKIKTVRYGSFRSLYELATAAVWVDNSRKAFMPPKRKGQFYIQTWHSPLRLKKIEKDADKNLSRTYIERAHIDSANCDLMTAGNDFSFNIYRNSFWYDGEIVKYGTPRCDILINDTSKIRSKVNSYFKIESDEKLLLYAPTFRSNLNMNSCLPDFVMIKNALEEKFGSKWRILVRFHPKTKVSSQIIDFSASLLNATGYDDIQELLAVSEVLITDYSSSMFDMLIAGKPCFIHAQDIEEYRKNERGLYFNQDQIPFDISKDSKGLIKNIIRYNYDEYSMKLNKFRRTVNMYEYGNASDTIADIIREKMKL